MVVTHDPAQESLLLAGRVVAAAQSRYEQPGRPQRLPARNVLLLPLGDLADGPLLLPDVDHFFPHLLKQAGNEFLSVDGVWNLVLACKGCNRGPRGKSDRVPSVRLLERLHARNEFLITSHHPLRETLVLQTGLDEPQRRGFLRDVHDRAGTALIHRGWEPS